MEGYGRRVFLGALACGVFLLLWHPTVSLLSRGTCLEGAWNLSHDLLVGGFLLASIPVGLSLLRRRGMLLEELPLLYLALCIISVLPLLRVPTLGLNYVRMEIATLITFSSIFLVTMWLSRKEPRRLLFVLLPVWSSWALVSAARGLARLSSLRDGLETRLDIMGHTNSRAGYELLVFLLVLGIVSKKGARVWLAASVVLVLLFLSLMTSFSRGAWFSLACGVGVMAGLRWGWRRAFVVAMVMVLFVMLFPGAIGIRARAGIDPHFATNLFRVELWREVARIIAENPWGGCGYDSLWFAAAGRLGSERSVLVGRHAHNLLLHTWAELGILGLAALVWVFIAALRQTRRLLMRDDPTFVGVGLGTTALLLGILVHGLVDVTWRDYSQQIFFWSLLGWLAGQARISHQPSTTTADMAS